MLKMPFRKISVFSRKNTSVSNIWFFQISKFSDFYRTLNSGGNRTFFWNNNISNAFNSKFATFTGFEKKLQREKKSFKKPNIFFLKIESSYFLRNFIIWVAFYGKFATIWLIKNSRQELSNIGHSHTHTLDTFDCQKRNEKRSISTFWVNGLRFYYKFARKKPMPQKHCSCLFTAKSRKICRNEKDFAIYRRICLTKIQLRF